MNIFNERMKREYKNSFSQKEEKEAAAEGNVNDYDDNGDDPIQDIFSEYYETGCETQSIVR